MPNQSFSRTAVVRLVMTAIALAVTAQNGVRASGSVFLTTVYTQDFDTLASSDTSPTVPNGWDFFESGANFNTVYRAGTGSITTGDTYSFGAAGSTERAFGGLRSGSLVPLIGASFTNNTGKPINRLDIAYVGEQWRLGARSPAPADRIDFQFSTTAVSLTSGTWIDVDALDFSSPVTTGSARALDGNTAANRLAVSASITGLSIPDGTTFWIRWTDFDVNGADDGLAVDDFSITPTSTVTPTNLTAFGAASPSNLFAGETTLLTVTVIPATVPASTGIAVSGDLSSLGGSATQTFFDDGSNGDETAGNNVFSFRATIPLGLQFGARSIPVTVTDAQARSAAATIAVAVNPAIHDVQGSGTVSPLAGQMITTRGVVTAVKRDSGFFIQTPDIDADPATSEGVFVFTGRSFPNTPVVGADVNVTGRVQEFVPTADPFSPPVTEISGNPLGVVVRSLGNALPDAITVTSADTSASGSIEQLERLEGMRVHVNALIAVAPTQGNISESNATSTSNGVFFGVIPPLGRPFREAGIEVPDPVPACEAAPCSIPRFDANPERIRVDSDGQPGAVALNVTTGVTVSNITGVLDYAFRAYTILPDPDASVSATENGKATPVSAPAPDEFTVASFNLERFFDTVDDPDTSEPVLTAGAFESRLRKASLAIRTVLRSPDIIGLEEVEDLSTLEALAARVNTDAVNAGAEDPGYRAFLEEGNDVGGIDVGFLVKTSRVTVWSVAQLGKDATYINPNTNQPDLLNDRPSLVLDATVQPPPGNPPVDIVVVVNHLRSLSGIESPTDGHRVRTKRRAQAEFLAHLLQSIQTTRPGVRIVSVGDYNAFDVNDGYVDMMGTIEGTPAPANQVALASPDLVNPDFTDLIDTLAAANKYTYSFDGNAQVLDHILVSESMLDAVSRFEIARNDADFPEVFRNDPTRPERISDHDMPVAFFTFTNDLPDAQAGPNQTVLCDTPVTLDASGSTDPDGHQLTFTWREGNRVIGTGVRITVVFPFGVHHVTLLVDDGHTGLATDTVDVTVQDVDAPTVQASVPAPTGERGWFTGAVTIPINAADDCSGVGSITYIVNGIGTTVTGSAAAVSLTTDGTFVVEYFATDVAGNESSHQTITIRIDRTPPSMMCTVTPQVLWPPNHRLLDVVALVGVGDGASGADGFTLLSVTSNEADNGLGDGDTTGDIQGFVVGQPSTTGKLRAERAGNGSGRTYTLTYSGRDGAGNESSCSAVVTVPHSRK